MAKKVSINVRVRNNVAIVLREVEGAEEIKVGVYPDERFFVHKSIDIKGWMMTEFKTGLAIVYGVKTKRECIQEATDMLHVQERTKFLAQIDDVVNRYGYANEGVQNGQIN